ncbi:hypothetical protein [Pontibacter mangrovi]|uniref:hypothetical protein n=1 Tax=Pontibacter mangrovi TaxID=2589816 RepID=UPI001EEFF6C0|nr:hypothetical protein [Pontibacter mangrovi]
MLLLLIQTLASACTDKPSEEEGDTPLARHDAVASDTASAGSSAATHDLLGNPLVADLQQSNDLNAYFDRIDANFTVDADAIENRHTPGITDSIYTIRFGDSFIEFYVPSQSGHLMLQVADIRSADVTLRNNLRVGMPQAELLSSLKRQGDDIRITQTPQQIIASAREGAPVSLHFFLQKGKVSRILYEGYVD